jgi:DNA invertase Pin-like site-specific DNA recombinase
MISTCALYLRVSSDGQSLENQRPELLQLAKARGLDIAKVYEEKVSAAKARPAYEQMMLDAQRGKYKALLIWSLDRFGRSMSGNLAAVLELDRIGVQASALVRSDPPLLARTDPYLNSGSRS